MNRTKEIFNEIERSFSPTSTQRDIPYCGGRDADGPFIDWGVYRIRHCGDHLNIEGVIISDANDTDKSPTGCISASDVGQLAFNNIKELLDKY